MDSCLGIRIFHTDASFRAAHDQKQIHRTKGQRFRLFVKSSGGRPRNRLPVSHLAPQVEDARVNRAPFRQHDIGERVGTNLVLSCMKPEKARDRQPVVRGLELFFPDFAPLGNVLDIHGICRGGEREARRQQKGEPFHYYLIAEKSEGFI